MPFCTSCGTEVDPRAAYCRNCGAPQPVSSGFGGPLPPPPPRPSSDLFTHLTDRTACLLCYIPVCGIVPAVVCLATQKYRTNYRVRFHAFQALYLFVAWLVASSLGSDAGLHHLGDLARVLILICWIYMLVRVSQQQDARLPIVGDLAARSTHEQL